MRLTLVIHSLFSGGAERVMSTMANYWAAKGWEITLLAMCGNEVTPFYTLDSKVTYIPLGIAINSANKIIGVWNNLWRIKIMKDAITRSNPDIIISFMDTTNIIVLMATRGLSIPVVVSERIEPSRSPLGRVWKKLRKLTYSYADKIVVQSNSAFSYFLDTLKINTCIIIPNPVLLPPKVQNISDKVVGNYSLMAMGRFEIQKGFDILLKAFAKIKDTYPKWKLIILGDGSLRFELESLRDELGLSNQVYLPGKTNNPYEFLREANIFVMSSRYEGFPNALCEAMACGLPVISTDCPSGPREIIRDGVDGILVPSENVYALATAMERLMSNEQERQHLAANASDVTQRFSLEKVMGMWEKLIEEVIKERKKI
ncbi:MAG: glycosyltransferase family 4 protein [Nostoc sp.]|uniref:glycosyltransferase family 4 protein n=1 Tax=Nostoc sp. TaxID=1180 RepID=UPI002FF5B922